MSQGRDADPLQNEPSEQMTPEKRGDRAILEYVGRMDEYVVMEI